MAAVPPHITTTSLTGIYTLNRTLSDSSQQTLKMQNVGWLVRQAVAYSNIETTLKQYTTTTAATTEAKQQHHLDQHQLSTGGIRNFEDQILDWQPRVHANKIWGEVRGKSRYAAVSAIEDEWLREGWDESCTGEGGKVVEAFVEGVKDRWTAHQVWGFAIVEGQRRHVRRIIARREGWEDERVRMVYDWKGVVEGDAGKE